MHLLDLPLHNLNVTYLISSVVFALFDNHYLCPLSQQKTHPCTICEKSFISNYALQAHLARHRGEKPHACNDCGKTFYNSTDLKVSPISCSYLIIITFFLLWLRELVNVKWTVKRRYGKEIGQLNTLPTTFYKYKTEHHLYLVLFIPSFRQGIPVCATFASYLFIDPSHSQKSLLETFQM